MRFLPANKGHILASNDIMNMYAKARRGAGTDAETGRRGRSACPSPAGALRTRRVHVRIGGWSRAWRSCTLPAGHLGRPRPSSRSRPPYLARGPRDGSSPSDGLMAEWLVLSGAWDTFGADECAAMLEQKGSRRSPRTPIWGASGWNA